MTKSAYIRARIEPMLKAKAEAVFNQIGMTPSQVITMLYKQVSRNRKVPLELHLPNKETAQAIKKARKGQGVVTCKNMDDLFEKLDI